MLRYVTRPITETSEPKNIMSMIMMSYDDS